MAAEQSQDAVQTKEADQPQEADQSNYEQEWSQVWEQHCDQLYWQFYDKFMAQGGVDETSELQHLLDKLVLGESIIDQMQQLGISDPDQAPCDGDDSSKQSQGFCYF